MICPLMSRKNDIISGGKHPVVALNEVECIEDKCAWWINTNVTGSNISGCAVVITALIFKKRNL